MQSSGLLDRQVENQHGVHAGERPVEGEHAFAPHHVAVAVAGIAALGRQCVVRVLAVGHEGLREMAHYARERFSELTFEIDVAWTKVDPLDPSIAHAAGEWRMAFVARDGRNAGEPVRTHGGFAQTWRRGTDGTWRIYRDVTLAREGG